MIRHSITVTYGDMFNDFDSCIDDVDMRVPACPLRSPRTVCAYRSLVGG